MKLLHFPNISPTEQKRLLMSDSESGSASEKDPKQAMAPTGSEGLNHKHPRKKSWTKRSLDMQRKISLSKLKDEKQELDAKSRSSQSPDVEHQPTAMHVAKHHSLPPKLKGRSPRSNKVSDGYDQYLKQYLLQVPMPKDYGEPSSDDLSSEWDSDVTDNKNVETIKESKVKSAFTLVKLIFSLFPYLSHRLAGESCGTSSSGRRSSRPTRTNSDILGCSLLAIKAASKRAPTRAPF